MTQYVALQNPVTYEYDKDYTIQCTRNRTNQQIHQLSDHVSGITNFFLALFSCSGAPIQIQPNEDVIVMRSGIITEVLRQPGFYSLNGNTYTIYVGNWRVTLTDIELYDRNGIPCWVTASYNYQVIDPIAAHFNTPNHKKFVRKCAIIALNKAFAQIKRSYWEGVADKAQKLFQSYVSPVGIQANGFTITAVKISQTLCAAFAKQTAQAFVDARKVFAKGAIKTLALNLRRIEEKEINLTKQQKAALAINMTYMLFQADKLTLKFLQGEPSSDQMHVFITTYQTRSEHDHKNRHVQTS